MKELIVPLAIVGVLASIMLPVPPALMDFLIVANVMLAFVLFLSTLYISDSLKLSALPSMLLLAALLRLAINISTTRNILSSGYGGRVVEAFGSIVIQGNLVVGVVIFLIITLVQFIVIAKGSERVAEVSARFSLDALPGRQMSIDADVRAGLIDFSSARIKRQDLQTESRFYGALDGAMKFIKGDAVAAIVITAINSFGGFAIGMLGEQLSFSQSLSKYTLLTVGDGLAAQIPALLNSLAAGIVVTRVMRGDDNSLAYELLSQIGQVRRVKVLSALICAILACTPALPALPFLALCLVLGISAWTTPDSASGKTVAPVVAFAPRPVSLLKVEIDTEAGALLHKAKRFAAEIESFRERVFLRHGLIVSVPEFTVDASLTRSIRISVRGIPVPLLGRPDSAEEIMTAICAGLDTLIQERITEFIDDILTRRMLDVLDPTAPDLVSAVVPGVVTVTQITEILKHLARENISIRNFEVILQAVAEFGPKSSNDRVLLEEVRIALCRTISHALPVTDGELAIITVDPIIDLTISRAEREKTSIDFRCIEPVAELARKDSEDAVVLVSRGSRRMLREYLNLKRITTSVVAFEELIPNLRLRTVAHATFQSESEGEQAAALLAA